MLFLLQLAYKEAVSGLADVGNSKDKSSNIGRDDRIHGSLLIINELIMNSSFPDEVGVVYEWVWFGMISVAYTECEK